MSTHLRFCGLALAFLATLSLNGCNQLAGFGDAQHFVAGSTPVAIGVADFTGDGKLDVVTANAAENEVGLMTGDGAGAFQISDVFEVGNGLFDLTVTDLNEDGDADVVTGNSGSISMLLGNGNGTFQAANNVLAVGTFSQVIAADFTKDGNVDLAAVSSIPLIGGVFIRPGDGAGNLSPATTFVSNPNTPISLAAGDFNGDGNLDIITANVVSNNVSVYPGDGTGALGAAVSSSPVLNTRPNAVDVGDFDKDGKLDAVIANLQTGDISLLFGNGDNTFRAGGTPASLSGAAKLKVAHVDGDGNLDIITANPISNDITLLYGKGDGTFELQFRLPAGTQPIDVDTADFNGDGKKDLVTSNRESNDISVLLAE